MKKIIAIMLVVASIFVLGVTAYAEEKSYIEYSEHLQGDFQYDLTGCSIAWVKQAKGALIWTSADDIRTEEEIISQAKNADPSLANAVTTFTVLRGDGKKNTPNTNGSRAVITVSENTMSIEGDYSHFVRGKVTAVEETPVVTINEDKTTIRIDAPRKMAVKFEDGSVYYGGEMKEVVFGQEYLFQMCTVNWDNGLYDGNGNGLCGTVVYRMKVVHLKEFNALKASIAGNSRYTVKGIDIIDNEAKTIIINGDDSNAHLETDVNNFFMAYRFHFTKGDYNKQTGIVGVINTPLESLSVNLPLGATVTCDAYSNYGKIASANVFIENSNYDNVYLTSVNDYTWDY